jgi:glycosyltransferase involved in cell wall biosynthesis
MKVSVIIPTYNCGKFIKASVESVLNQSFTNFELLVIDDGSTDNTHEIIRNIKDSRLIYIKTENNGVSSARNKGIEISKGEYIAFLDADDLWEKSKLELQVNALDHNPNIGFVFTDLCHFNENDIIQASLFATIPEFSEMRTTKGGDNKCHVITDDTFNTLVNLPVFVTCIPTSMFRSNLIKEIRFPVGVRLAEDYYFMLRIYNLTNAAYLADALVKVRRHDSNSHYHMEELLQPVLQALYNVLTHIEDTTRREILKRKIRQSWISAAYYNFWYGSVAYASYAYFRSLFLPGPKFNAIFHIAVSPFQPIIRYFRPKAKPKALI